jgi:hypothetical protein
LALPSPLLNGAWSTRRQHFKSNDYKDIKRAAEAAPLVFVLPAIAQCLNPRTASMGALCPWMRVGLGCDEKHFPQRRQHAEIAIEPRGPMDTIQACVSDVVAIANSVAAHDLPQAKRRLELLFADVGFRAGASSGTVQNVRDRLANALNQSHGPTAKQFLDGLITWLDREHLERGIRT